MAAHQQTTPDRRRTGIDAWLDERIHSGKSIDFVLNHPVPLHIHPLDYLGETTLFIFISQAVTGMLLAMFYHPVAQTPYFFWFLGAFDDGAGYRELVNLGWPS